MTVDPMGPLARRPAARPTHLVLVTGTATEIGKTWVSVALLDAFRTDGRTVAARKPAQSFEPGDDSAQVTDAHRLGAASGETVAEVCPPHRWYPVPMAPPMAASVLGQPPFTIQDLARELRWPATGRAIDVGLVETAGGASLFQRVCSHGRWTRPRNGPGAGILAQAGAHPGPHRVTKPDARGQPGIHGVCRCSAASAHARGRTAAATPTARGHLRSAAGAQGSRATAAHAARGASAAAAQRKCCAPVNAAHVLRAVEQRAVGGAAG